MRLTIQPSKTSKQWAFYMLYDELNNPQYAGVCEVGRLLAIPDARSNALFTEIFADRSATLEVLAFTDTRIQAQNARSYYMGAHGWPHMNKYAAVHGIHSTILCNETGETFRTIDEVVAAHGVTRSALSNHLSHKPGFITVKSKTYQRVKRPVSAVPSHAPALLSPKPTTTETP